MFRHKKNISFLTFILLVVVVKWFPSFTSSPSHFLLDIWNPGGGENSHMKRSGMLVGKFEFNS